MRLTPPRSASAAAADLLLQRAQRLVGGAAHGADQCGAVPHQRVRVLAREALLQFHERGRVGQAEQLLRRAQVGLHHALDQARHPLLEVAQAAFGGVGQRHQLAHVLGGALGRFGHLAAHLFEALRRVLGDLALALRHRLRAPACRLVRGVTGAAHRLGTGFGAPTGHVGARLGILAERIAGGMAALLHRFGAASDRGVGGRVGDHARVVLHNLSDHRLADGLLGVLRLGNLGHVNLLPIYLRHRKDCCTA